MRWARSRCQSATQRPARQAAAQQGTSSLSASTSQLQPDSCVRPQTHSPVTPGPSGAGVCDPMPLNLLVFLQVRRRPHLQQFLERCAALFEVVVFTASQKVYAEQLLNVLDPTRYPTGP